ncbi:MAG: hypothetical protein IT439_10940 [Phycisphaerales bacterium]|nr:hypothetical protein [Phycisphaerales bacterium]
MRSTGTWMLVAAAGLVASAAAGPTIGVKPMAKAKARAVIAQNVLTGQTVSGREARHGRAAVIPYNTHFTNIGTEQLNWAWVTGDDYATGGAGSGSSYYVDTYVTTGPAGAGGIDFTYTLDNGTPTNPNDDLSVTAFTDAIFDDFAFDTGVADVTGTDTVTLLSMRHQFSMDNFSADDNGTPTNPNDDFFIPRNNTVATLFWAINDNGTPTNPNDDFPAFTGGVNLTYSFGANSSFNYSSADEDVSSLGVQIPGAGIVMQDWENFSPSHIDGDNGAGMVFTGGDDQSDGTATGLDSVVIPAAESIINTADLDRISTYDEAGASWFFAPTSDPTLIDPAADGNASDTTYTDIMLSGFGINWAFSVPVGANGNAGPGEYDLPGNLGYAFTVEFEGGCAADLTGSSDPNDPSYGVPDGDADADDFFFYLDLFVANNGDLSGSSDPNDPSYGVPDGDSDADDFFFYLDLFVAGCP